MGGAEVPSMELVQSLFNLTVIEGRMASIPTMRRTVDEIASEKGALLTRSTPKWSGAGGAGSRRQAEVIALLRGIRGLAE